MPTYGPDQARCVVRTFKAGLLSAVGHDLLLRVNRFSVTVDDDRIEGSFDGTSLEVLGAVRDGEVVPGLLSPKDAREVLENIRKHVFRNHRAGEIHFLAEDVDVDDDVIEGDGVLTIPPRRHGVRFEAQIDGDVARCEVVLHQPDWGIEPFRALMGALRIQPDVRVDLEIPWTS